MKKLILGIAITTLLASTLSAYAAPVSNAEIKEAVRKYKAKNYVGCLQDTQAIVKKDPTNAAAFYYQGLAYSQLGKKSEATDAYTKVINLNSNASLVDYATKGVSCLNGEEGCKPKEEAEDEMASFIKSDKFYGNSVQSELNKKKLNQMKDSFNNDTDGKLNQKSEVPTNDEIAAAVKTLAKAGLNPLAGMNGMGAMNGMNPAMNQQSAEMMQMNMLLGNNNNNNGGMQNMIPMMMMNQEGKNISPELIQSMMMSNMAAGMNYDNNQTY